MVLDIAMATAQTAVPFGVLPWHKRDLSENMNPTSIITTLSVAAFQMSSAFELVKRVEKSISYRKCLVVYEIFNIISLLPIFGLKLGFEWQNIKKYGTILHRIQQVVGVALSGFIAVYDSPAYGITCATWIVLGIINEHKPFSKNFNLAVSGIAGVNALALGVLGYQFMHSYVVAFYSALFVFKDRILNNDQT